MSRADDVAAAYDAVPYESAAETHAHPDRLATYAFLYGVDPPPPARARVLEIGCGTGASLASIAAMLPDAELVGIDRAASRIAAGQKALEDAGLSNVKLRELDFAKAELGTFDYVLAHGIYSWVPRDVQDDLLEFVARSLAPKGVAYVSHNTYPGWHARTVIRDALLYEVRDVVDPKARIRRARAHLDWLASGLTGGDAAFAALVRSEIAWARSVDDAYFFHELLAVVNEPVHLHRFVARAERVGLAYLGDTESPAGAEHGTSAAAELARAKAPRDRVAAEQHLDFLANRSFRRSMLVHRELEVGRFPDERRLTALSFSTRARRTGATFTAPDAALATDHAATVAALDALANAAPSSLSYDELRAKIEGSVGAFDAVDASHHLLRAFLSSGIVELRLTPLRCGRAGERPAASPWARALARAGKRVVANLRHENVTLDEALGKLLVLLDGSRTRTALAAEMRVGAERLDVGLGLLERAGLMVG